jgi:hypothetical protein
MSAYRTAAPAKVLPARCVVRFDELPRASRDHLREVSARAHSTTKRERHTRVYAILSVAAGVFVLVGAAVWSQSARGPYEKLAFDRQTPWDAGEISVVTGACFLVGALLLGGIASLVRQRNAPLGTFWYGHEAYLLDCAFDRVIAHPLALLDDQDVVGETAQLSFGDVEIQIAFDLPAEAVSFLIPLRQNTTKAAACLARGAVDEIPGADFIPDALLYRKSPRFHVDRAWMIPLFAGLALALAGRVVLPGLHARNAEARLVSACHETPEVCPKYPVTYPDGAHRDEVDDTFFAWTSGGTHLGRYRAAFPAGRHLSEIATAAQTRGTEALERYRKSAGVAKKRGDPLLVEAISTTLGALRDARSNLVPLRFTGTVDDDISYWNRTPDLHRTNAQAIADPLFRGLDPGAVDVAKRALTSALAAAAGDGAIDLRELGPQEEAPEAAATLAVSYRIFKGQRTYEDSARHRGPYAEIAIEWTLTFNWPASPGIKEMSVTLHTSPRPSFDSFAASSDVVYSTMLYEDAKSLGVELERALGLRVEAP